MSNFFPFRYELRNSECLGMNVFFRGIAEIVPSLIRGILSQQQVTLFGRNFGPAIAGTGMSMCGGGAYRMTRNKTIFCYACSASSMLVETNQTYLYKVLSFLLCPFILLWSLEPASLRLAARILQKGGSMWSSRSNVCRTQCCTKILS